MTSKCRWFVIFLAVVPAGSLCAQGDRTEHVWKDGKWVPAAKGEKGTPKGEIALIRQYLDQGRARSALKAAKRFLDRYPTDSRREEAMMLAAQAEKDRGHYYKAYERFNYQLDQYPNGKFFERGIQRQYEIADAFLKGRKRRIWWGMARKSGVGDGLDILTGIAQRVPGTVGAEKAVLRAADYHYEAKQVVEAVDAYDSFIKMFPKNPRLGYAMLRAARATYAQYRGEAFDDTPLVDAQHRFSEFSRLYPEEAKKANIPMLLSQIRNALVRRSFATAKFYQRVGRRKAAIFYYKKVIAQHADSHWARRAKDALVKLGYKDRAPDKPTTRPRPETQPSSGEADKPAAGTDRNTESPKSNKVEK